jgi:hypothetical protein
MPPPKLAPLKTKDGAYNPEHFRDYYRIYVQEPSDRAVLRGEDLPKGLTLEGLMKRFEHYCRLYGFDAKDIIAERDLGDKMADAAMRILDCPDALLEQFEDIILGLHEQAKIAHDHCTDKIIALAKGHPIEENPPSIARSWGKKIDAEGEKGLGKLSRWLNLLEKLIEVRQWARGDLDEDAFDNPFEFWGLQAARVLIYQVYVHRSTQVKAPKRTSDKFIRPQKFHACMAVRYWQLKHRVKVEPKMLCNELPLLSMAIQPDTEHPGLLAFKVPPGHGKTDLSKATVGLDIADNINIQGMWVHHTDKMAEKEVASIRDILSDATDNGRRYRALFPHIITDPRYKAAGRFRVIRSESVKEDTWQAAGMGSSKLGADIISFRFDDFVPQSDAEQPTERKRRSEILGGTFLTRARGTDVDIIFTGYSWHQDDALESLCRKIKSGQIKGIVSEQRCGGPKDKFWSLWPDVYPPEELAQRYEYLGPRIYAANYMQDPAPEASRIVGGLSLFNVESEGHKGFLESCERFLSIDPSAMVSSNSDETGWIYAGLGQDRVTYKKDGSIVTEMVDWIRVISAKQFKATTEQIGEAIIGFSEQQDYIDCCVIEHAANYGEPIRQYLEQHPNDAIGEVVMLSTGNRNKENRLRSVAPMIDATQQGWEPVVQFPGVLDDNGDIVPHPDFKWLYDQIIGFGSTNKDHCVDALTQLLRYLSDRIDRRKRMTNLIATEFQAKLSPLQEKHRDWVRSLVQQNMTEGESGDSDVAATNEMFLS